VPKFGDFSEVIRLMRLCVRSTTETGRVCEVCRRLVLFSSWSLVGGCRGKYISRSHFNPDIQAEVWQVTDENVSSSSLTIRKQVVVL
jgi:hypothetical protein